MSKQCYRILLVEDDADDRYIMHQAFEELSFTDEVKMFAAGEELNAYLSRLSPTAFPDLIVLDYNMPALNGAELAHALKKDPVLRTIPVVLYSTGMSPKMQRDLMASGVLYCYEKGMEYGEVLQLARSFTNLVRPAETLVAG
jgi:CheY-like chemotaxis protein